MYYLGFDIGGTKCAVSVGFAENNNLHIIERQETPTLKNPHKTLSVFKDNVLDDIS